MPVQTLIVVIVFVMFLCIFLVGVAIYTKQMKGILAEVMTRLKAARQDLAFAETSLKEVTEALQEIKKEKDDAKTDLTLVLTEISQKKFVAETELETLKQQQEHAAKMVEKDLEIERERRKTEFQNQLESELAKLQAEHPKTVLMETLKEINAEIETARRTLLAQQESAKKLEQEEDFVAYHSLDLSVADLRDIEVIRQIGPQLSRQDAINKLIWTEFYQKPLQILCKTLGAEKIRGIYMITNIKTKQMYIGQAWPMKNLAA